MSDLHPDELLAAFALDALTGEERESVLAHLVGCARCRHEVGLLRATSEALPLSISDVPAPSLDLRERILREAARTEQIRAPLAQVPVVGLTPERRRASLAGWVAAAALLLALVGLGIRDLSLSREIQALSQPATLQGQLVATADAPGAGGTYALTPNREGRLIVANLPPPTPGQVYEAWVIDAGGPKPAGTFVTTPDGHGTVILTQPASPGDTLAITNEPAPGTQAPSGKILLKATV
jgi:hypothetical protein